MDKLTKKQQGFVKDYLETGNGTQSALNNYDTDDENTAAVIASENLRKPQIQEVIVSLADRIPDDKLHEVLMEGLEATKAQGVGGMAMNISKNGVDSVGHTEMFVPDYPTRHKYLDTALKIKGAYETDESKNINVLMPVLVKFLNGKEDRSDNGDTQ